MPTMYQALALRWEYRGDEETAIPSFLPFQKMVSLCTLPAAPCWVPPRPTEGGSLGLGLGTSLSIQ